MTTGVGLRERKKEQTRQLIASTAQQLFAERGFDAVTVADVARAAEVSPGTVFNYFPTKEDLFYSGMQLFEASLVDAVRSRPVGKSVLAAFRDFILANASRLEDEEVASVIARAARLVAGSAALQARERELIDGYTDALAELLVAETRASAESIEPKVVASALMSTHRVLVAYVHARVLAGRHGPALAADFRVQAKRAFGRLERGFGDYDVRRKRSGGS